MSLGIPKERLSVPKLGDVVVGRAVGLASGNRFVWHACVECGKERWVRVVRAEPDSQRCRPCSYRMVKPRKKRRGRTLSCPQCGSQFYRPPSGTALAKYCSRECQREAFKTGKIRKCRECGTGFYRKKSQARLRGATYCSPECQGQGTAKRGRLSSRGREIRTERLDAYFSKFVRLRDGLICQRCLKTFLRGDQGLHCAHFIGRANHATRWDPDNCVALCYGCHQFMDTHKGTVFRVWLSQRLGQEKFDALVERSQKSGKRTRAEKLELGEQVREWLRSVNDGRTVP